ncbi:MAG TPA: YkgJ family cysteine cluster protein [Myxococcaceae bacterium]|nr:YkgJ family cysteine cluster protein [Myxococcaceae bacterium]
MRDSDDDGLTDDELADDSPRRPERAVLRDTRAVYRLADKAYAPFSCPASGECCQLSTTQRQPWLWRNEWLVLKERLSAQGRALPPPRADGGCPLLDAAGKRCTVYEDRPFGCRTFFCQRITGPSRQPREEVIRLSLRLEVLSQELDPELKGPRQILDWAREEREG